MGWSEFAVALCVFLLSHAVPVRAPVKPWLVERLGPRGFAVIYSALSLAVLVWLIGAAARAPQVLLWPPAAWQNWLAIGSMLVACEIVALSLGRPNPFSFGGPDAGFDPGNPGLVRAMRHPLLWALAIWALAHGLANGTLAHGAMFFGFAGFAILGMRMIDGRRQLETGGAWQRVWRETTASRAPLISLRRDGGRIVLGLVLWLGLLQLHNSVLGVSPWP